MNNPISINPSVLFLQKPHLLEFQAPEIREYFRSADPELPVAFAGKPDEMPEGHDFEVLVTPALPWLPEVIARLPSLRWIHFLSAGVDPVWEMDFPKERFLLSSSRGINSNAMAEFALGLMLSVVKDFRGFARNQAEKRWERHWLEELTGKQLLIVGTGSVGSRLAAMARSFDMRVTGVARQPRTQTEFDSVIGISNLNAVLPQADFVVLAVPLTPETRGLFGRDAISAMGTKAWLINLARGEIVDESALIEALEGGRIGGAALDVFTEEPLPAESPLWSLPNVILTPHVSGTTNLYMKRAVELFFANLESLRKDGRLLSEVLPERGY